MAWDAKNKRVLVKAIGTVESNLNYTAINYSDPITVGFMQWYGGRAANILSRISREVPYPLANMGPVGQRIASGGGNWESYFLTQAAGNALKDALDKGKVVQQQQAIDDFNSYATTAKSHGLDPDTNTDAFMMWCVGYHQGPKYAFQVLSAVGGKASLDQMYQGMLSNRVLGQYRTRYSTAYNIIKNHDDSGITAGGGGSSSTAPKTGGDNKNGQAEQRHIKAIHEHGDELIIKMSSGETVMAYKTSGGLWQLGEDKGAHKGAGGGGAAASSGGTPSASTGARAQKEAKLEQWFSSRNRKFGYAQAPGRLTPDSSGYSDCSACIVAAYRDALGINPGWTYTGDMYNKGTAVYSGPVSGIAGQRVQKMKYGDVCVFGSGGSTHHVAMYAARNASEWSRFWDAGSAPCPKITDTFSWDGPYVWVRRMFD